MTLDTQAQSILRAVLGMGFLSFVMSNWMGLVRLAAMRKAGVGLQEAAHTKDLRARMPSAVQRVADNYNHLFEAPTVFYAVALAVVLAGFADSLDAICAWGFLACRTAHSLVQATVNIVLVRLSFYLISWALLAIMIIRALLRL